MLDGAIAVVGMAGRFPGARNVEELWRNLGDGVDAVHVFTEAELRAFGVPPALIADPAYVPAAAQPPDLDRFDAGFFGINHREAEIFDPQQRVFLETCWEALEDAGYDPDDLAVTGVFAGQTTSTYLIFNLIPSLMGTMDPLQLLVGNAGDSLATRVSYKLNLKGPSFTVQSACSSSAVAVHTACQSLLNGECDLALAGGVSINVHLLHGYLAAEGSVFAKSGRCRAFDAGAEGILFGGGAGVVVLKRAEEALRDGDNVQALILGSAVNNDGSTKVGYTAPSVDGQAEVISEAWAAAGVEMETASYIEAHGTGTRLGDPIEIQALTRAFPRKQRIPIGSVKTNVGHLDVAAGIAGLIKTVLALKHRQIPPSLHFSEPNPEIDFANSPVYVNTELRRWEGSPRRAGVSSFGFGGTNVHLVLEEAPEVARAPSCRERYSLQVSARSEAALELACQRLADHLESHPELDLADVEYTLRVGRRTFEHRRVVECRTREEAVESLRRPSPPGPLSHPHSRTPGRGGDLLSGVWGRPSPGREGVRVGEGMGVRVSLPTYPFERRRYWIDPPGLVLPEAVAAPSNFHPRPALFNPYEPPRDGREETVCRIWQEVLGVEPVGVHDDFFQLGGHSLLATQILSRVRDAFAVEFPLEHLFSFPTAAELAEAIGFLQEQAPDRIPRAPRSAWEVLSSAQERIWFLEALQPGTSAFNLPASVHLRGRLDPAAVQAALDALARRHETLRTRFVEIGGRPAQEILAAAPMPLPRVDLEGLPESLRAVEEERLVREIAWRPFRLDQAPLLRTVLLRSGPDEHRLVLAIHHVVADGWSLGVLQRDFAALYRRESLPELPIQYADYAVWQRERMAAGAFDEQLAWWRERLAGVPFLELRSDRPRPPVQTFRGGNMDVRLAPDLARALAGLAGRHGASPFMALLVGLDALLQRYTGQDDFAVGTLVANRNRSETEGLIGAFLNNLALRTDLSGDPGFGELLRRVRDTTLDAYARQDLPFERLLEELRPERDLSRPPVFQVAVNLLNLPVVREELPGLVMTGTGLRGERANFDLLLWMAEDGDGGLSGWIEHNADLFDSATVQRMAGHLERLLAGAVADPERRVQDLPLLSEAERTEVLETWNRTFQPRPAATFPDLFAAQVERTPDAVASVCGEASLTYRELDGRARSWAGVLAGRGVGPESLVAILSERGLDFLTGVLAVLQAGGAYLPLDPHQPAARSLAVLRQSGARWLLSGNGLGLGTLGVELDVLEMEELAGLAGGAARVEPESLAYVIYTSGSTGLPKGAMIHHRGMLNHLLAKVEDLGLTAADAVAQNASQSFDISVWQLLVALLVGGRVHLYPDEVAHDPAALLATVERDGVTVLEVVPSLLAAMLDVPDPPRLSRLRWLIPTGEALPPELCGRWLGIHPEIPLLNAYGPTECSDDVSCHPIRQAPGPQVVHTPIGRPIANTQLYVVDRELRPLPAGVAGELCAGGLGVGRGYLAEPLRTAQAFVPDPFGGSGLRLYRTGDLARWLSTGEIEFLGRVDFQVKVRGFRIEPGEIESVLGRHAGVHQAVVVALEERGEKRLVAYVVGEGLDIADLADLRAFARERLPESMVPAAFVLLPAMPFTPNGKVDRRALPAPVWEAAGYVPPSTPMEEVLAGRLWPEVLGVSRVGARDNFFELGGHSLTATRLTSRVAGELGLQVPLRWIFESPVLADYAARLDTVEERAAVPPLRRVPRDAPLPLSFAQERLWVLDQLQPGSPFYNLPSAVRLEGALDVAALAAALREVVRRHESLRTTFADGPIQVIAIDGEASLPLVDLSALPAGRRHAAADRLAGDEARRPFDLGRGPLLRVRLLRLAEEEHVVLATLHHIVSDAWSAWVLVRDLAALYGGSPLPELPVQYADYAVWQRAWLQGEVLESQLRWWKRELAGAPAVLELPLDHPRPAVQSFRGATEPVALPPELAAALAELARGQGGTLFMALLAGFQALLHRSTGQEDLLVGSPVANRQRRDVEELIGFFVNTLVLRGWPALDLPFRALLEQARSAALGAYAHQDLPFERLVEELRVERSLSHGPLFQAVLVLQNAPAEPLAMPGLTLHPWEAPTGTSKFDLTLSLTETAHGLAGSLEYATDLFDRPTMVRLLDRFRLLLEGAAARPEAALADLPVLSEVERLQLLEWSRGEDVPAAATLDQLFAEQVARRPEATALRFPGGEMSYAELDARADGLAGRLRREGVGPDVLVGIFLERSPETIVAILAILRAGGAYVPLDPAYPADRLAFLLEDSAAPVLLTRRELLARLPDTAARMICLDGGIPQEPVSGPTRVHPDNLAYVMYTSGSTGRPKGVAVTHRNVARLVRSTEFARFGPDEVFLQLAPISFDASTLEIWGALLHGGTLVLFPPHTPTLEELGAGLQGITTLWLTAGLFHLMVETQVASLAGLRQLLAGGDTLSVPHVQKVLRELPGVRLINGYGPTENTTFTCCHTVRGPFGASVPVGRPIANTRVHVLDAGLRPVPPGVVGELCTGGDGLARGYLRRQDLTAERFVPDPMGTGERLYRTGDLARLLPTGEVELLGRMDQQVKIRGFRIEPGEIEAVLSSHPSVSGAAVVVRGMGGDRSLMACLVAPSEIETELRAFLRERLPDYMVPAEWVFLDALPLSPNGKVDRRALARLEVAGRTDEGAAPRTPTEEVLAGIWADLLGRERVGVREDFFEIGGHSLLGTRLISRVRQVFGAELPLRALFEAPTVAELAVRIEQAGGGESQPPLRRFPREGALPLSFAQERLWFLDRLAPGSPVYNIPSLLRASGDLDVGTLRRSLAGLAHRHETLRTTFAEVAGSPVQVIAPEADVPLPVIDLRGLPADSREAEARRLAREEARRPFDLARGPLFRTVLLRTGEGEHFVLFTLHHVVGDGWSMSVVVREVGALYGGSPLPELPVQYADFALWQRGEVLENRTAWWREELAGAPAVLELPADRPRPATQSFRGATVTFEIPSMDLIRLARREGATPFMVLLAALQALLGRLTGQEDVLVGSPVAGRDRVELEGLVGLFVNTLVLRGRLAGGPTFQELLARTRASALGAYAHQELPFERLVDELGVERSLSHNPLFQVLFALQNAPLGELALPGLTLSPLVLDSAAARVDLALSLWDSAGGFAGTAEYSTDLFDRTTVLRLVGHLRSLLEGALEHPETRLSDLPLFGDAERHQLDREWNDTAVEEDGPPAHQLFERQVEKTPDAIAVVFQGESLTYAELDRRAEALACRLRSLGAGPESRVGLAVERSLDLPVAVLGIWKSGAAYVPLDPGLPAERLAFQIEDAGVTTVVTQELLERAAERSRSPLSRGSGSAAGRGVGGEGLGGEGLAYLIYTSGTTGRPKAVLVEHRHLAHTLAACRRAFSFRAGDRMPCIAPFSFDIFLFELLNPLLAGGTVEIFPLRPALEVERLVSSLSEATHFHAVPALMRQVVESARTSGPFPRLRELFVGGDAVPAELLADMAEVFPSARTFVLYGPTEASIICSCHAGASRPLLGRPLPGSVLRLMDADRVEVPIGVSGEIWIGGGGVSRGYLHQPELTAERFAPGEGGTRWYRTGDLARRLPDGTLEFLGRIDNQVKVRGFRIELGEIEARLATHPAVREAVVLARGEGEGRRLVAYIVAAPVPSQELVELLSAALPDYMIPSAWVFLDALPLSSNGKVDRRALARIEPEAERSGSSFVPPRTATEELLAALWAGLLGVERVGIHDRFFDLGGHSLLAARLAARVRDAFGIGLDLRAVFETPDLAGLAARLDEARRAEPGLRLPPLRPRPHEGEPSLSFAQERLWFLDRLEPGSPAYNMPMAVRLRGALDVPALERALTAVARRHETLRTTFAVRDGRPVQVIAPEPDLRLVVLDLRDLPGRREEARRRLAEEAVRPFDLERGPLCRALLLRLEDEEHLALFTLHHAVGDGWSMGVLLRELTESYEERGLPDLPVQYADHAVWQREWLQGETLDRQLSWWKEELAGAPTLLDLPADRPRPPVKSFRGSLVPFLLPARLSASAAALARREGATLFMTLLAAFQTLLARYTGQDDLLVGVPVAGRSLTELEGLIGFFVNTVILRGRLQDGPDGPAWRELLGRTRAAALGAFAHQDLPFERLVEELGVERSLAHGPLVQVTFALQNAPLGPAELPGLTLEPVPLDAGTAKFDLTLSLWETGAGLAGTAEYDTDLFDRATVVRLLGHFETLLAAAVEDPGRHVSTLPLLTLAETWQISVEWNATAVDHPWVPVHRLFEAQAAERPDAPAVVSESGTLTYRDLDRRANRLAHRLRRLGVGPETVVALCLPRSPELVTAALGVLKAGGAYLPVDPAHPAERLDFILHDSGALLLLTDPSPGEEDEEPLPVEIESAGLAYVIYTSGSTGAPKGTELTHAGLSNLVAWHRRVYGPGPEDRTTLLAGPGFDASVWEVWPALASGASLHVPPPETVASPSGLLAWMADRGITLSFLPTPLAEAVLAEPMPHGLALRTVLTGGDRLRRRPGPEVPFALVNHYGPTEATVVTACGRVEPEGDRPPGLGRPVDNLRVHVLDPRLRPVPVGVPGELCVAGIGLARGYLGRPDLTAERFLPDPSGAPGDRLYRTGDLARLLPDGEIEFLGRLDHQVKIRGFRIELGEVESVLGRHPEVREAVVLAQEGRLVAYVVSSAPSEALRAFLADRLPEPMIPSAWVFLDALPLTPNGKVDRAVLARLAPERTVAAAARTPTEEVLAGIWSDLLGVGTVGSGDGFFELGGHSLLATRLTSRIRDVFQVELPLRTLFEAPRLADLAARIDAERVEGAVLQPPPVEPADRRGPIPLSFAQERLWFLDRMEPGGAFYSVPAALRVSGHLDPARLHAALAGVVQRHEALRTTFGQTDGAPFQIVSPEAHVVLPLIDLAALPPDRRERETAERLRAEARQPFDLARGPLLRALLLRAAADEHAVLLNLHHIVADGWSVGVLVRELAALYQGAPLPDPPLQYADFAVWQRRWLSGDVLEAQIEHWRRALAGAATVLDLPSDRPRPPVQTFRGAHLPAALPAAVARAVQNLARSQGATLFMTLLAGLQTLLHRYTGQEDVLVGLPIAGRRRSELEGLIGLFVNALALRGRMAGDPAFAELLARVRTACLNAYAHQELPFERLVEELQIQRSLARHPVFQVVFALQNLPFGELRLPGLTLAPLDLDSGTAKLDLLLSLGEGEDGGLGGGWEYSTDLFDATTIERMTGHLAALLAAAAEDPARRLSDLPLLTGAERVQLLLEWNDTRRPAPEDLCLHDLFLASAERRPDAVAAVYENESLTYAELADRAATLADRLRAEGVGPESLVGICLDEGLERLVAVLGVFLAGGAYLPLDPSHPRERLDYMIEDAGVRVVLPSPPAPLPGVREGEGPGVRTDNLAYVIYTSGSTGRPNGVMVTHGAAVRLILYAVEQAGLGPHTRVLQAVSFSFDASVLETWTALASGGTLCIAPKEARLSSDAMGSLAHREGITFAVGTPSALALLPADLSTLDTFLVGGESCPAELANRWAPPASGLSHLFNCYGPTETTIYTAAADLRGAYRHEPPIGRPVANARAYVLDARGRPVPAGVPGELYIAGPGLARGYLNRPALTAERFVPDPFDEAGARLYRTGDLARWRPEGELEFLGRVDRQVKIRGLRIELGEIEATLGGHPAVRECAVLAREGHAGKTGDKRLVAYVVPRAGEGSGTASDLTSDLRVHLRERLPEYMVPAGFVFLEAMPLTPTGKIDRGALPGLETEPEQGGADPRDVLELRLARIWQEVLAVPRVGVHDDFFDLGGHSLLAVRLLARVHKELGRELPLTVLFDGGTVERMADLLRRGAGVPVSCLVPIQPGGSRPPFFCVHPAGGDVLGYAALARHLGPDQPFYGLQSRGLSGEGEPHLRIEDMAAHYLEEIRRVQPAGPYHLGGWSLGGMVAFEMARQLEAHGGEVALLAVLDATPGYEADGGGSDLDLLLNVAAYVESLWGRELGLTSDDLAQAGPEGALALLLERLREVDLLPPGAGEEQLRRTLAVYRANAQAARAYVAAPYPGRVTLFRTPGGPQTGGGAPPDLGWGTICAAPVEVHVVPGEHLTLLAEPHVRTLAHRLGLCLKDARAERVEA